jgi:GAF domain-containing protein
VTSEFIPEPNTDSPERSGFFLKRFWNWLTSPSTALSDIGEKRSARLASSFLFAITLLDLVGAFARIPRLGFKASFAGGLGFSLIFAFVAYLISRTKWYRLAIFLFSLSFSATAYFSIFAEGDQADFGTLILVYVPLGLIVASSFLSSWAVFLLVGLNIGAYFSIQFFGVGLPESIGAHAGIITAIGIVLILLVNFRDNTENARLEEVKIINRELESLSNELEQRVKIRTEELETANQQAARRTEQLTAIAELARSLTDIQDLESLLPAITAFVSQRLNYYHVGIFLNDEGEIYSVLRAANSAGGKEMIARGHRLRIGTEGMVGYVVNTGHPRIALDVGSDAVYFDNPELPDTHSEMALPLRLGPEIIGALDIQSTEANAFSAEDMAIFSTLADQIAIAIQNARLLAQAQSALKDVEEAYAQQTGKAWQDFSKTQSIAGYYFDGLEPKPLTNGTKSKNKFDAKLTLPMRLRGQTIGRLKFKNSNDNRIWSKEEISLAEAALERAAIALENARLLEEAQRRATKERVISEGATRVSAALDVESVLQATAKELERALGGSEVIIQLESEE